jgi:hypothetical protein
MNSKTNFQTYLLIDKKKFILCVIHNTSFEIIYSDQMLLTDDGEFKFEILNEFLEKNIFKVEKRLKNFVQNIDIILDNKEIFSVKMSIKKNNNGKYIDSKSLLHPLNDLKKSCQSNFNDKRIIHMLIENYLIDGKNYFSLPKNLKCDFFSLDVNFICLSNNFINDLELTFKKYHILVNKILSASYVEKFMDEVDQNIFSTASIIKSGLNENEVSLVSKNYKNKGFFEKFFNFFN